MGKKRRYNDLARSGNATAMSKIMPGPANKQFQASKQVEDEIDDEYCSVAEPNVDMISEDKHIKKKEKILKKKEEKQLSKRKTKQIEKILEKRKKKAKRSELLASLAQYQVTDKELAMYQSVSKIGQSNMDEKQINLDPLHGTATEKDVKSSILSGKKRAKRLKLMKKVNQPNLDKDEIQGSKETNNPMNSNHSSSNESTDDDDDADDDDDDDDDDNDDENDIADEMVQTSPNDVKQSESLPTTLPVDVKKVALPISDVIVEDPRKEKNEIQRKKEHTQPAVFVEVKRTPEIQAARVLLPILAEEQTIMETVSENNIIIICGETGSGKTTQVPQFLYEAGYGTHKPTDGMIGITEPRRVAAISMSKRVATEMNIDSSIVSYQIRYEGNVRDTTRIKFMTDGVLLKEMETDFLLTKYSVIIIDEAHERSIFTDILIGLLSRVVPLRNKKGIPMKLIIMSATLRIEDFIDNKILFPSPPPVLKIDSRQYPVTIHFNKKTAEDYVTEAYKKVCKIHRTLKSGGILVFVTGQNEVHSLCRKLKQTFGTRDARKASEKGRGRKEGGREGKRKLGKKSTETGFSLDNYPVVKMDDIYEEDDGEGNIDISDLEEDGDEDDNKYDEEIDSSLPLHVLPLFSLLPTEKQAKVFDPCPDGFRLCVISTNVAETSLTIPGIKYVVDCGKVKTRYYDKLTGVSSFRITWTSKASANQRAGRAGRVEPGHCYRLYSSAVFQHEFDDYAQAEICRRPADELFLLMKNMGIEKVNKFPFPSAPDYNTLQAAENHLINLGALEKKKLKKGGFNTVVTALGKTMGQLPVAPRYAKMILLAHQENCLPYVIILVASLTVKEIFTDDIKIDDTLLSKDEDGIKEKRSLITQARRKWAGMGENSLLGDMMVILRAVGACEFAGCTEKFCRENGLRHKAMVEIRKLRAHLSKSVNALNQDFEVFLDPKIKPPTEIQTKVIRQILLSCLGDRVARKISPSEIKDVALKNAYESCSTEDPVFIHPASAMFDKLPEYVVYQEIIETSKLYMKGIIAIEENWLPLFAPYSCTFSNPLQSITPVYDCKSGKMRCHMTSIYGPHSWVLPAQELDFPHSVDRFKWFAAAFLEGKVCEALKEFVPYLLSPACVMTKTWAKLQPRTEILLKELIGENVSDKKSLIQAWKANDKYLLVPYLQWMPESLHDEIRRKWPPVL